MRLRNPSFHACSRENKNEGKCANSAKNKSVILFENCDEKLRFAKHWCRQLIRTVEKCELAANNGDTLVEVVISAKRTNSD
jgi:hypothetical protein